MSTIQTATEILIRLAKQVIHPDTVLVFKDDLFEVQSTPSVILQGPKLTEDRFRRGQVWLFENNMADLSFEECRFPRLYHLDFDLVVTVDRESKLLQFQPLTFQLGTEGSLHLGPRQKKSIAKKDLSTEIQTVAKRGLVRITTLSTGGAPVQDESAILES